MNLSLHQCADGKTEVQRITAEISCCLLRELKTSYDRDPLIQQESFSYHVSSLRGLGSCDAREDDSAGGTDRVESSMKSKQKPQDNGQAKDLPHPQPTPTGSSSIKPPVSCLSAQLSRDSSDPPSPVTLLLFCEPISFSDFSSDSLYFCRIF